MILPASETASVPLPEKKDFYLFLLAGQSNMAGRGKIDAAAQVANPNIFSLNKAGSWQVALDPLHWDKAEAGTGLGKPFAELVLAQHPGISIGLIPAACGGSPISTWFPGQTHDQTRSNPYDDAISRSKRAMQDGTLKAILWHQGEGDANPSRSGVYEKRLEEVINNLRAELGAPEIPFIMGQLGRFPGAPWKPDQEKVDQAQQALAKRMKNVYYVSAEGLTSSDKLHFDTPSLRILAQRYAEVYLSLP